MSTDWKKLISLAAPAIGSVASGDPHFWGGYQTQQAEMDKQRKIDDADRQKKALAGSEFLIRAAGDLQSVVDPIQFDELSRLYEDAGVQAGYLQPGQLREKVSFPKSKQADARLKELTDLLDGLQKNGYDVDAQAESGAVIKLKDGSTVPIASALEMTRQRPLSASGAPIPRPGKPSEATSLQRVELNVGGKKVFAGWNPKTDEYFVSGQKVTNPIPWDDPKKDTSDLDDLNRTLKELQIEAAKNKPAPQGPRDRFSVQSVTNPDGTTGLIRVNMDTGDVSSVALPNGADSGRATEAQRIGAAYLARTTESDRLSRDFEKGIVTLGGQIDPKLPNLLTSPAGRDYRQAQDEFINAALRRESGAAIAPSEYDRFAKIYFIQPGDTPSTMKQKQAARVRVIEGFKLAAGALGRTGAAVESPDAAATARQKLQNR